ncbi:hypothetical protein FDECE_15155 [Fusarium decemcellulare]|nr:hypothetical protein FDECE_15155 [Fusarium decemcellulare]
MECGNRQKTAEGNAVYNKPKSSVKIRKRARKACLSCRARKVRCDVSQRGRPCMNCYLDSEACIVTGRATKKSANISTGTQPDSRGDIQASLPPYTPFRRESSRQTTNGAGSLSSSVGRRESCTQAATGLRTDDLATPEAETVCNNRPGTTEDVVEGDLHGNTVKDKQPVPVDATAHRNCQAPNLLEACLSHGHSTSNSQYTSGGHRIAASDVVYCHYAFLAVPNISNIPPQDVNFLEVEGCLRVPIRPLLDDFVKQYFRHVHPVLPLLNEGDFWELYQGTAAAESNRVSLLLLQAMLFASCTFIPEATMRALGYPNMRSIRGTLLRRTKLLYDLGTERSPLAMAQAALLLTLTSLSSSRAPHTSWLSLAIDNAKLAEAHRYATMTTCSERQRSILKRVWWCCVIRDRSIGLLLRRPIQITNEHFNFNTNLLHATDFENEAERSKVYSPPTKRHLADILARWVRLYVALTDTLLLAFPPDNTQCPKTSQGHAIILDDCKAALKQWHTFTSLRLPNPQKNSRPSPTSNDNLDPGVGQDSAALYTNLMYMYYHTSRITLCHYEVFRLAGQQGNHNHSSLAENLSAILESRNELQDATSGIMDCQKDLVRRGLVRWLPISAIGCIVLPLVLNILDIKLDSLDEATAAKQHQVNILIQAMKDFWPQYEGVDWIIEIVRYIISTTRLRSSSPNANWADIFAFQPSSYLRLALALDISLSKGRLPQDKDFPSCLGDSEPAAAPPPETIAVVSNSSTTQGRRSSFTSDLAASPYTDFYTFGIDEAFIGNLEDQIHWHTANGFPDNGLSQFMGVGMDNEDPSSGTQRPINLEAYDFSVLDSS